jgi:hypothetical protein
MGVTFLPIRSVTSHIHGPRARYLYLIVRQTGVSTVKAQKVHEMCSWSVKIVKTGDSHGCDTVEPGRELPTAGVPGVSIFTRFLGHIGTFVPDCTGSEVFFLQNCSLLSCSSQALLGFRSIFQVCSANTKMGIANISTAALA